MFQTAEMNDALCFYNDMQKNKLVNNNWILGNISNAVLMDYMTDAWFIDPLHLLLYLEAIARHNLSRDIVLQYYW